MMVNEESESERVTRLDESEINTPRLKAYGKGSKTNDKIYTHEWVDTECIMMTQSDLDVMESSHTFHFKTQPQETVLPGTA